MKEARELRAQTRETFKGQWGKAIALMLLPLFYFYALVIVVAILAIIFGMIAGILSNSEIVPQVIMIGLIYLAEIFGGIILWLLLTGVKFLFIDWDNNPQLEFSAPKSVFNVFNYNVWMIIKISLWQLLFTSLWSLLFYIPGIIKTLSYSQAFNLYKTAVDNGTADQYRAIDYITQSKNVMDGHKWDFFYLQLTFIGWSLLAVLTLGIGFLWLMPYMIGSEAAFYNDLMKNNKVPLMGDN